MHILDINKKELSYRKYKWKDMNSYFSCLLPWLDEEDSKWTASNVPKAKTPLTLDSREIWSTVWPKTNKIYVDLVELIFKTFSHSTANILYLDTPHAPITIAISAATVNPFSLLFAPGPIWFVHYSVFIKRCFRDPAPNRVCSIRMPVE